MQFRHSEVLKNSQNDSWRTPASPCWGQRQKTVVLIKTTIPLYFTITKQSFVQFRQSGALKGSQDESPGRLSWQQHPSRLAPTRNRSDCFSRLLNVWTAKRAASLLWKVRFWLFLLKWLFFLAMPQHGDTAFRLESFCLFLKAPDCLNCTTDCF